MTALPANTPCALLEQRLAAWFQTLVEAPVPERLLRHLDDLAAPRPERPDPD